MDEETQLYLEQRARISSEQSKIWEKTRLRLQETWTPTSEEPEEVLWDGIILRPDFDTRVRVDDIQVEDIDCLFFMSRRVWSLVFQGRVSEPFYIEKFLHGLRHAYGRDRETEYAAVWIDMLVIKLKEQVHSHRVQLTFHCDLREDPTSFGPAFASALRTLEKRSLL